MNYEEKYNEALERARKEWVENLDNCYTNYRERLEIIFPELAWSEDDKNIKDLIDELKCSLRAANCQNDACRGGHEKRITLLEWAIDWLEKQGERPTDKVESKFKVGDCIVQENIGVYKVIEICESWYEVVDNKDNHYSIGFDKEYMYHLWTIEDAKEGDVLVDSYSKDSIIILYKGIDKERSILAHCGWNGYNLFVPSNDGLGYGGLDNTDYLPATKEQRDLLFQKMKEAGYEWDAKEKEVKKIEQKKLNADEVIAWLHYHIQVDEPKIEYDENGQPLAENFLVHAEARCMAADEVVKQFKKDFGL